MMSSWLKWGYALTLMAVGARAGEFTAEEASPAYITLPAANPADLTPANGWPAPASYTEWTRSHGGATSNRFSGLNQINRTNVDQLEVAWVYHSGDGADNVQANPIIVDGLMIVPTPGRCVVGVDAATGEERWRFDPELEGQGQEYRPARRGLVYWPGDDTASPRVFFTAGEWIFAIDPATGRLHADFGEHGRTSLPGGSVVAGAVHERTLVIPGFQRDVFGYDTVTGELRWTFHTVPQAGEFGADTWTATDPTGANCWGGIALDQSRGIAYFSTGSPKPNYMGARHTGRNLFSNSLVALDANTGERLWHFQEIRHDIWDLDVPAPPNLVTVMRDGRKVDAVAQVTKIGNTLLLDRVTGDPLFPFRLRRAPAATIPGEETWPYQPDVEWPEPFARQEFKLEHVTNRTPEARSHVLELLRRANFGWFEPFAEARPTVFYGMHGGAEWTGSAFDPGTGYLYVSANEIPWAVTIFRDDDPPPAVPATAGETLYQQFCAACHGADLRGVGVAPPLRGLRHRMTDADILKIVREGRASMPALPFAAEPENAALIDFLQARDRPDSTESATAKPRYAFGGYQKVLDHEEYPGVEPPWGTLNCIDLNTGRLVWQVPLGEYPELTAAGVPTTGTENFGGASVTAGGLVFCSGTRDRKIRAFDAATGEELWSAELPLHGTAPPSIYDVEGRQYVVVPATGSGKLRGPGGDTWVAFTLPD